jgi:hypothetical protein
VRGLGAEGRQQERGEKAEGAVELARVPAAHERGVVAEPAVEEQQLPEPAAAAEEGGQREERDGREPRDGRRGGRRERWVGAERERLGGGDEQREREEGAVRGGAAGPAGVVQQAPLQEHAEVAQLVVDHRLAPRVRRVQEQRPVRRGRRWRHQQWGRRLLFLLRRSEAPVLLRRVRHGAAHT